VVFRFEAIAQRCDDADWFVAKDQPGPHGVFALHDVDSRAADGRGRDADQGLAGSGRGDRTFFDRDLICAAEGDGLHRAHRDAL
jgi:hypothetical protein